MIVANPGQSKEEEGKYQESIQSSTTPDIIWESEKDTKKTSHTRESRGQPFPSR